MPNLVRELRKRRRPPVGELNVRVDIQNRTQVPPDSGDVDASFSFSDVDPTQDTVWAKVDTTTGKTYFDGVATDRRVTHEVTIRFLAGVSSLSWVILPDGQRLNVVDSTDLDERGEFIKLACEATGDSGNAASEG